MEMQGLVPSPRWTPVKQLLCVVALLMSAQSALATNESVQDLRYGVTLYHFFQQDYFEALTELGAAQQLEQLPHHGEEAELLRGGMSLSYGMDSEAREIFDTLLDQSRERVDADRAWFYLGKLAWRRGDNEASQYALAKMAPAYEGPLADEGHYMRAMQALEQGEQQAASLTLRAIQESCPYKPYFFYNLGAVHARAGDWDSAAQSFRQVALMGCEDEEGAALRDKAFTAAGFASLAADKADRAADDFLAVRLQGPETDRALLGYGWSYANRGQFDRALLPWNTLSERSLTSASARESLLAVPYAYEQLERPATALELYRQAASRYADVGAEVDAAYTELRDGDLLSLFGLDEVVDPQWLGGEDPQPEGEHARFLTHLMSTDTVQLALRELHDLRAMQRKLSLASERLTVLRQVDSEQRDSWRETVEGGGAESLARQRQLLVERSEQLRQRLDSAIASGNARELATPEQAARWQRVERATALAGRLQKQDAQEKLRVMQGLLQWQDNEAFPAQSWRMQRDLGQLEKLANDSAEAYAALNAAMAGSARPVFAQRIDGLAERTRVQQSQLAAAMNEAQSKLRAAALAELAQQQDYLRHGKAQALLAVARLYDLASPEVPR